MTAPGGAVVAQAIHHEARTAGIPVAIPKSQRGRHLRSLRLRPRSGLALYQRASPKSGIPCVRTESRRCHYHSDERSGTGHPVHLQAMAATPTGFTSTAGTGPGQLVCRRRRQKTRQDRAFALLHPDGYALYRAFDGTERTDPSRCTSCERSPPTLSCGTVVGRCRAWIRPSLGPPRPRTSRRRLLVDPRAVDTTAVRDTRWLHLPDVPAVLTARKYAADLDIVPDAADPVLNAGGRFRSG